MVDIPFSLGDVIAHILPGILIVGILNPIVGFNFGLESIILIGILVGYVVFPINSFFWNKFFRISKQFKTLKNKWKDDVASYDLDMLNTKIDTDTRKDSQNFLAYYSMFASFSIIFLAFVGYNVYLLTLHQKLNFTYAFYGVNLPVMLLGGLALFFSFVCYWRSLQYYGGYTNFMIALIAEKKIGKIVVTPVPPAAIGGADPVTDPVTAPAQKIWKNNIRPNIGKILILSFSLAMLVGPIFFS